MCRNYMSGNCEFGDGCFFSHSLVGQGQVGLGFAAELPDKPDAMTEVAHHHNIQPPSFVYEAAGHGQTSSISSPSHQLYAAEHNPKAPQYHYPPPTKFVPRVAPTQEQNSSVQPPMDHAPSHDVATSMLPPSDQLYATKHIPKAPQYHYPLPTKFVPQAAPSHEQNGSVQPPTDHVSLHNRATSVPPPSDQLLAQSNIPEAPQYRFSPPPESIPRAAHSHEQQDDHVQPPTDNAHFDNKDSAGPSPKNQVLLPDQKGSLPFQADQASSDDESSSAPPLEDHASSKDRDDSATATSEEIYANDYDIRGPTNNHHLQPSVSQVAFSQDQNKPVARLADHPSYRQNITLPPSSDQPYVNNYSYAPEPIPYHYPRPHGLQAAPWQYQNCYVPVPPEQSHAMYRGPGPTYYGDPSYPPQPPQPPVHQGPPVYYQHDFNLGAVNFFSGSQNFVPEPPTHHYHPPQPPQPPVHQGPPVYYQHDFNLGAVNFLSGSQNFVPEPPTHHYHPPQQFGPSWNNNNNNNNNTTAMPHSSYYETTYYPVAGQSTVQSMQPPESSVESVDTSRVPCPRLAAGRGCPLDTECPYDHKEFLKGFYNQLCQFGTNCVSKDKGCRFRHEEETEIAAETDQEST
ncbi:hypothetical protein C8035_v012229 [Colletotrichum spinosum]|uniref:C3H1-type domain-containing protein n=1 Tax=Colletotrichum spinosum TaxID=1347390 RepID=A0A4R8Q4A7_9PEZI|nr:hypothetical protein C8035_v012229 [Colletotrichum spinosum]